MIHRDYASTAPIQIRVYDHRITLWNPGQLPPDWSVEQLTGEHSSRPHNPGLAYAFFRAGMIEAWGRGIRRIAHACETAGNPAPEWKVEPGGGLWLEFSYSTAYRRTADLLAKQASADEAGQKRRVPGESRVGPGGTIEATTQETEATTQERILALIEAEPEITRRLLAERVGITPDGVKYHLDKLRAAGVIRHVGATRAGRWEVLQ